MLTVLRVAQELSEVDYRKVIYRLTPSSLRYVERPVPPPVSPVSPAPRPPSPDIDNGLHLHEPTSKLKRSEPEKDRMGISSGQLEFVAQGRETKSFKGDSSCPARASSVTTPEQSSSDHSDQDQTLQAVMGKVEAMMTPSFSISGGSYSNQSPWLTALMLAEQTAQAQEEQQPYPSQRDLLLTPPPTPLSTRTDKRRHTSSSKSTLGIEAGKRVRQSLLTTGQPWGAQAPTNAAPLPALSSFIPVVNEYEYEDVLTSGQATCLGSGAFGEVFLRRNKSDGDLVAFKTLLHVTNGDMMTGYHGMVEELRVMMAVQHHPEFPKVIGIVNLTTFAMEFVGDALTMQPTTLRCLVKRPPAILDALGLVKICLDIAKGLQALHDAGWSHNDLHSSNVLVWQQPSELGHNWGAKIIDLGKATRLNDPDPVKDMLCMHIPPELTEGPAPLGVLTDLYSMAYLFSDVIQCHPGLTAIETVYQQCKRLSKDMPPLKSIIQYIEGLKTSLV